MQVKNATRYARSETRLLALIDQRSESKASYFNLYHSILVNGSLRPLFVGA